MELFSMNSSILNGSFIRINFVSSSTILILFSFASLSSPTFYEDFSCSFSQQRRTNTAANGFSIIQRQSKSINKLLLNIRVNIRGRELLVLAASHRPGKHLTRGRYYTQTSIYWLEPDIHVLSISIQKKLKCWLNSVISFRSSLHFRTNLVDDNNGSQHPILGVHLIKSLDSRKYFFYYRPLKLASNSHLNPVKDKLFSSTIMIMEPNLCALYH